MHTLALTGKASSLLASVAPLAPHLYLLSSGRMSKPDDAFLQLTQRGKYRPSSAGAKISTKGRCCGQSAVQHSSTVFLEVGRWLGFSGYAVMRSLAGGNAGVPFDPPPTKNTPCGRQRLGKACS